MITASIAESAVKTIIDRIDTDTLPVVDPDKLKACRAEQAAIRDFYTEQKLFGHTKQRETK